MGALAYAGDLLLPAPTPSIMRELLAVFDNYAQQYSFKFNAKKSKCFQKSDAVYLAFWITADSKWLVSLTHFDRVTSFVHLGHTIIPS